MRNNLDDVLVIPCSSALWHQHTWGDPILIDRSMVILYLYEVQRVLERLGVKTARFRPHPSLDKKWIKDFIDNRFYSEDSLSLDKSLEQATLVIGATSSTFIEALMKGVNYMVIESIDENDLGLCRTRRVPPFYGSEKELYIARDEIELENI